MQEYTFQVDALEPKKSSQRLDAFLAQKADISRAKAKKAIEEGQCLVNGKISSPDYKIRLHDIITYKSILIENTLEAEEGALDILYQDEDYIIINKPPYLTVHPAPSQEKGTLVHLLLSHFPQIAQMEGMRPGIVHRIDKDTSGILVIALHDKARRALSDLFARREIHKEYLALVHNLPPKEGFIDKPIGRHESQKTKMAVSKKGKEAFTEYTRLISDTERNYALLSVRIHTGRTHQIRVHLSSLAFPLWGDKTYTAKINKEIPERFKELAPRQMLHAWKIQFIQPLTGKEINITCPLPDDIKLCLQKLKERTKRYIITGNPASGKSLVLQNFQELACPVFSADAYVHELYSREGAGAFLLKRVFGEDIITDKGVDRKALLKVIEDGAQKKKLESIIHPLVYKAMNEFFEECERQGVEKAFAEVPLFFETAGQMLCDELAQSFLENSKIKKTEKEYFVITVWTDEEERQKRLQMRGWTQEVSDRINSWHLKPEEKKNRADFLIENSSTREDLRQKCLDFLK